METMNELLLRMYAAVVTRSRDERGDVPGWVLVTVMTAGLVAVLWEVAEGQLRQLLADALGSVS